MKRLTVVLSILLLAGCLFAQTDGKASASASGEVSAVQVGTSPIDKNWFVELGVGGEVLFSKDASYRKSSQRLTPFINIAAGKWFTPYIGARLHVSGYQLNGASSSSGLYIADPTGDQLLFGNNDPVRTYYQIQPDGSYAHNVMYLNAHVDLMTSILNLVHHGYREDCPWDAVPAIGLGYMHVFNYKGIPAEDLMTVNFSLRGSYRIRPEWEVYLEAQSIVVPDQFDGRITGSVHESAFEFSAGFNYLIGGRHYSEEVGSDWALSPRHTDVADTVVNTLHDTVYVDRVVEKEVIPDAIAALPDSMAVGYILFSINSATPQRSSEFQLQTMANYLRDNASASIRLDGYADKDTGTEDYNRELSLRRANAVKDKLVGDYGVDASRISVHACGSSESQPYEKTSFNRMVVALIFLR